MFRSALWITLFGLIVSGCASDGKIETSGGDKSSMSQRGGHRIQSVDVGRGSCQISFNESVQLEQ